jgi:hypothetical protein
MTIKRLSLSLRSLQRFASSLTMDDPKKSYLGQIHGFAVWTSASHLICTSPGYQLSIFPYSHAASNTTLVETIDSTSCTLPLKSPAHRPRHYATLNSGTSPISCLASPPALYDTRHLSLADSTFLSLLPACHTLINCVTPRLCFGSSVLPVCGFSCSS